jgi:hypothetical protein
VIRGGTFIGASTDGVDFSDSFQSEQYHISNNALIANAIENLRKQANDPRYIMVDGKPLSENNQSRLWRTGMIVQYFGGWDDAYGLSSYGFYVCDGRNGTPTIHPANPGGTQRYTKATDWGTNSNPERNGGSSTHTHSASAGGHTHGYSGSTDSAGSHSHTVAFGDDCVCKFCQCASGAEASLPGHCHDGVTGGGGAHTHDFTSLTTDSGDANVTVASGGGDLPYVEVIYLMYKES